MLDDASLRLLGAVAATALLGSWSRRRALRQLQRWRDDPAAMRDLAIRRFELVSTTPLGYLSAAITCFMIVLFVETFVLVIHGLYDSG